MPRAALQSDFRKTPIEGRVIVGAKLLENNRDVTYRGDDGKPISFRTNDGLLDGLISHAGNRAIPAHLTHSWADGKQDALLSRVGAFKNFRRNESGDLIGDFHAMPGADGDRMLWLAEHDPEHAALSIVFDWNKLNHNGVTYAVPVNFRSADFVASGAGVTALLSNPNDDTMTETEFDAMLAKSPAFTKALGDSITAALAKANLITKEDADKLANDKVTAALAAHKPTLSQEQIDEITTKAEAGFTAKLGANPFQFNVAQKKEGDEFTAKLAEYRKAAPTEAAAIARLLKDHPHLQAAREDHARNQVAKLSN